MPSKDPILYDDRTREDWRLRLALLKESAAYRQFWAEYTDKARSAYQDIEELNRALQTAKSAAKISAAFERYNGACETLAAFNTQLYAFGLRGPYGEALEALDPRNVDLPEKLPVTFHEPLAVVQIEVPGMPLEARAGVPLKRVPEALAPSERILKLDLSRKRGEIEAELKRYLDAAEHYRASGDVPEAWRANYEQWEPDRSRFRTEAWQALEVYRMRRQRKTFLEIAKTLKIHGAAAKKAFRRAYELIEARRYEPEFFRREAQAVRLPELRKTCGACSLRETCEELCPDVLGFVVQDEVIQRELTIDLADPFLNDLP